ncbi:MAG: fused N-dimethylarginine dimethylaminohydrolase/saccharopine dehydrogenase domain-containing protein, partial [Leptolyngbya sp. SIO1D8]|nr:fused N-dimethylarginine dimethylaminohydrolase/saccharopine dehydrogenase domain-containing protein [Leptolyngbya sp. SIO1D8]
MKTSIQILMCPPEFYGVEYVINPWMEDNVNRYSHNLAKQQWQQLYRVIKNQAFVKLISPQKGWPDMVFTANAGLLLDKTIVLSRFQNKERQGEEPHFRNWFEAQGFKIYQIPRNLSFEGAGDALLDRGGYWLWAGYGFRSELASHSYIAERLNIEVISLCLVDQRFYHLDTCFCPLADGYLLYYPPAFDAGSNRLIEMRVAPEKRIMVGEVDAYNFACNAVNIGQTIICNRLTDRLKRDLTVAGFHVLETPLTE